MHNKIATVFGGTGFLGRQVVRELAKRGVTIKAATRVPERAYFLRPNGKVGQIVPFACDYSSEESLRAAVADSDYVVNCVGILHEKKKNGFEVIHATLPGQIARECARAGVARFVHISALGIEESTSKYGKTKLAGEAAVLAHFPKVTILRPSVMFGEGDDFFNRFAKLSILFPFLPLIGGGKTKFQPVYVGDVADAVMAALSLPNRGDQNSQGQIYELGGPEVITFREVYERLFRYTHRRRKLIPVPWGLAKMKAAFLSILPKPPLTPDQVESLKTHNIVHYGAKELADLSVTPTAMDLILPRYLNRYRPGGRFADLRAA